MTTFFRYLPFLCAFSLSIVAADPLQQNIMLRDLDTIHNFFTIRYAPAEAQLIYANWSIDDQIQQAKTKVAANPNITVKEYQRLLQHIFSSAKDYHVDITFNSTELALLPFQVMKIKDKYYVTSYETSYLQKLTNANLSAWTQGSEVISFGDRSVDIVVEELKKQYLVPPYTETDQRLAENFLTVRFASSGHQVPSGPISVTIKHPNQKKPVTYNLKWLYLPEEVTNHFESGENENNYTEATNLAQLACLHKQKVTPLYEKLCNAKKPWDEVPREGLSIYELGAKKSFLPPLGSVVWKNDDKNYFDASIYLVDNKKIGFVRIPTYNVIEKDVSLDKVTKEFGQLISRFERDTNALVIDQMNNPGGYPYFMFALLSMLSKSPLALPTERISITQEDVQDSVTLVRGLQKVKTDSDAREAFGVETISGYPVNYSLATNLLSYHSFILSEWNAGHYLSNPVHPNGIPSIEPNRTNKYTKPILVLINEFDFSCADFFPAILQDNKRATLLGTKTAGAAGYVLSFNYPNRLGVARGTLTGSIAVRNDGSPFQNEGVKPDITVKFTERDIKEGFPDYISEIKKALGGL